MKLPVSKRGAALALLALLLLFLVRLQVPRLRGRVAKSLSAELNRPVEIGAIQIRFLPRPELEIENLIIHDSGAFGVEPLLRSPDVTAWLRVRSLLRGRIEIASLRLSDASLNLTRNADGKWSVGELIEQTARSSTGPTGHKGARLEFPYIQASRARINFKNGLEKTRFALTDAEFALWQESDNEWGMRLRTRPIRTDSNLTDTGVISVSGAWQRSVVLENTPVRFSLQWKQAQIGQVSRLFYGTDKGWRGNVVLSSAVAGTPRNLKITSDASIDDFRRHDVLSNRDLQLAAHCGAEYNSVEQILSNVDCTAPVGDGSLELKGSTSGFPFSSYALTLIADHVSAEAVLGLARHINRNIPEDLIVAGNVNMTFSLNRADSPESKQWSGHGEAQDLLLRPQRTGSELSLGNIPFTLAYGIALNKAGADSQVPAHLQVGPINVAMGRPNPIQAQLSLSRSGFQATIRGEAGVKRLLSAAHILHIPAPEISAEGPTTVNFGLAGTWDGGRPVTTGSVQVRGIHAQVRGLNAPLVIHKAELTLDADSISVKDLDASAGETNWRGSMLIPRPCAPPGSCSIQFRLRSPEVSAAALNNLLNPMAAKKPWYKFFAAGDSHHSFFLNANATGKLAIDKLTLHGSTCDHFSTDLDLEKGKLTLANMRGDLLGGRALGDWNADFSARPPAYTGSGSFEGTSLAEVAELMHDGWIDGSGSATYRFQGSGWSFQDLLDSAELGANFTIKDGVFPHVVLTANSSPLHARTFSGRIALRDGSFSLEDAKLESATGVYNVSGTASLTGALKLKMAGENLSSYTLSGTLLSTRVSTVASASTQAELKP